MAEQVHEFSKTVKKFDGATYKVKAFAAPSDTVWIGWLEFHPVGSGEVLRTGEETSQPDLDAVKYWASGLEQIYLEGALSRAK